MNGCKKPDREKDQIRLRDYLFKKKEATYSLLFIEAWKSIIALVQKIEAICYGDETNTSSLLECI